MIRSLPEAVIQLALVVNDNSLTIQPADDKYNCFRLYFCILRVIITLRKVSGYELKCLLIQFVNLFFIYRRRIRASYYVRHLV